MCRAGKDGRLRICPGQKENSHAKDAGRRLKYMKDRTEKKQLEAEQKIDALQKEAAENGQPPLDEKAIKAIRAKALLKQTDVIYQRHLEYAQEVISHNRKMGNETDVLYAKKTSGGDLVWNKDREDIHNEIIMEQLAAWADVPCEGEAIFSGGLGGAGKGHVLKNYSNVDQSKYATLNPDDIKEVLAAKGLIPKIAGLTPMEASPLVHEEASHITGQLAKIVFARKMNVIYDITMADYDSTQRKVERMSNSGYEKIDAIFVDISVDTSDTRAAGRHLSGHNRYLQGIGDGGRILPKGISAKQVPENDEYRSKNAENFLRLKDEGYFSSTRAFDNNVDGRDPIELTSLKTNVQEVKEAA